MYDSSLHSVVCTGQFASRSCYRSYVQIGTAFFLLIDHVHNCTTVRERRMNIEQCTVLQILLQYSALHVL